MLPFQYNKNCAVTLLPYWYLEELNRKNNVSDLASTCSQQVLSPSCYCLAWCPLYQGNQGEFLQLLSFCRHIFLVA